MAFLLLILCIKLSFIIVSPLYSIDDIETLNLRCVHGSAQVPIIVTPLCGSISTTSTSMLTCYVTSTTVLSLTGSSAIVSDVVPGLSGSYTNITLSGELIANQVCAATVTAADATSLFMSSNYYANMKNYQVLRSNASIFSTFGRELVLTSGDGVAGDTFGYAVAMSGDGSVVVVGAPSHQSLNQGALYVYRRQLDTWVLVQEIADPTASNNDAFGTAVAISYDGSTITASNNNGSGRVFLYQYNASTALWSFSQVILGLGTGFGHSVNVSATGQYMVITNQSVPPQAFIYIRNDTCAGIGSVWSLQQTITESGGALPPLDVTISADASTIALGLPLSSGSPAGTVQMFHYNGTAWSLVQTLTASDGGPADTFGSSVALSNNGKYLLVGAPGHAPHGEAYEFVLRGQLWNQENIFVSTVVSATQFGSSVALSADGTVGIIGAALGTVQGNAFVAYRSPDNAWTVPSAFGGHSAGASFGSASAISADGSFMVVGAPDQSLATPGSISIFRPLSAIIPADTIITGSFCVTNRLTINADLSVTGSIFVAGSVITSGVVACMAPSDRRLKKNIRNLTSEEAFKKLIQLSPVTFSWVNPEEHPAEGRSPAGLIAQDVEHHFPHWIHYGEATGKDGILVNAQEPVRLIALTPALFAYLVACVQGLEQEDADIDYYLKDTICIK